MITILLRILGVPIIAGGLYAAWLGLGANDVITGEENNITVTRSAMAGKRASKEKGEEAIGKAERAIDEQKMQRNLQFGIAVVALIIGIGLILMPSSRKRKAPAAAAVQEPEPAPTQNQDAPGP